MLEVLENFDSNRTSCQIDVRKKWFADTTIMK